MNFLELLDVFLIFCVIVVVNRYNILYTCYSSIFTIFYTTFWETSIKRSVGSFPRGRPLNRGLTINAQKLFPVSRNCSGRIYTSPNSLSSLTCFSFQLLNFLGDTRPKQRLLGLHAVFAIWCRAGKLVMHNQRIFSHNTVLAYSQ